MIPLYYKILLISQGTYQPSPEGIPRSFILQTGTCQVNIQISTSVSSNGHESEAAAEFQEAFSLRQSVKAKDQRGIDEHTEAEYDNLVVFWLR